MKRMTKWISLVLAIVMVLPLVPVMPFEVKAATKNVTVSTWDDLKYYLEQETSDLVRITLGGNIIKRIEYKNESEITRDNGYELPTIFVSGTKELELNGYSIECHDNSNVWYSEQDDSIETSWVSFWDDDYQDRALICVKKGAQLTVSDMGGTGTMHYNAYMVRTVAAGEIRSNKKSGPYDGFAFRDIFHVEGDLVINGGTFLPGRAKQQYIPDGRTVAGKDIYNGYAWQIVFGSSVVVKDGGNLIVNSGTVEGRGQADDLSSHYIPDLETWIFDTDRDEVIEVREGGNAVINGGNFIGQAGANVFGGNGLETGLTVKGGTFENRCLDKIRVLDGYTDNGIQAIIDHIYCYYEFVKDGSVGFLNIPDSAWKSKLSGLTLSTARYVTWDGGHTTIFEDYVTEAELKAASVNKFRGLATFSNQSGTRPVLSFTHQSPVMPSGADAWHRYEAVGEEVSYTFNNAPLTPTQKAQGYQIVRSYVLRDSSNKTIKSLSEDRESTPITMTYTFDKAGMYTFVENLSLYQGGTYVTGYSNTFYVFAEPVAQSIVITTQPNKTSYQIGEYVNTAGMKVTAFMSDGTSKDVSDFVVLNNSRIRSYENDVIVSYSSSVPYEYTVSTTLRVTLDTKVNSIDIGITAPTPDANPDYRVKRIDHNRYSPAKYGLKENGIYWYDSEGNVMEETDTFKAGETYQAEVKLVPGKDDYGNPLTFKSPLDSVLVNLKNVTSNPDVTVFAAANAVYVYYNFTCVSTARDSEILEVEVAGVTLPEPGAKPDYTAVAVHPLNYRLSQYGINRSGMYWTEEDSGNILGENDTFTEGKFYTLEIKLEVADLTSSFQYPLVATIGGDPVDASDIYFSSKTVYLFARYFCGDEAVLEAGGYGGDYVNLLADMNDDEMVDSTDAIYLLYHVLFGQSRYPIYKSTDLNKSGTTDSADAIYLLYYTLFGSGRYPI